MKKTHLVSAITIIGIFIAVTGTYATTPTPSQTPTPEGYKTPTPTATPSVTPSQTPSPVAESAWSGPSGRGETILLQGKGSGKTLRGRADEHGNIYVAPAGAVQTITAWRTFTATGTNLPVLTDQGKHIKFQTLIVITKGGTAEGYVHFKGNRAEGDDSNVISPFGFDDHGGMVLDIAGETGGYNNGIYVDVTSISATTLDVAVKYQLLEWSY